MPNPKSIEELLGPFLSVLKELNGGEDLPSHERYQRSESQIYAILRAVRGVQEDGAHIGEEQFDALDRIVEEIIPPELYPEWKYQIGALRKGYDAITLGNHNQKEMDEVTDDKARLRDGSWAHAILDMRPALAIRRVIEIDPERYEKLYRAAKGETPCQDLGAGCLSESNWGHTKTILLNSTIETPQGLVYRSPFADDNETQRRVDLAIKLLNGPPDIREPVTSTWRDLVDRRTDHTRGYDPS